MAEPIWFPSPNHSDRAGRPVRALVIHVTAGVWPTDRGWLCNPASKVSAHEIIAPDGQSYRLVTADRAAFANGILNRPNVANPVVAQWAATPQNPAWPAGLPNLESYAIEVSGRTAGAWTAPQRAALVARARWACQRFNLATASQILRHGDLDSVNRPGCPMPAGAAWEALVHDILAPGYAVGPGVLAVMQARGDEPVGDEEYVHRHIDGHDIMSVTPGRLGQYTWNARANRVTFTKWEG